jgi:primosomal protein N' (replication factor Y)
MYYIVHIPVHLRKDFIYRSTLPVSEGCRVAVLFNRREMVGVCGTKVENPPPGRRYNPILEILDDKPLLPADLIHLARWMASYYETSTGLCLFAMLPTLLVPDVEASITWTGGEAPHDLSALKALLENGDTQKVKELRAKAGKLPLLKMIESAAEKGFVTLDRKVSHAGKARVANFVKVINSDIDPLTLPDRQKEAMQILNGEGGEMPMSQLSESFSYSVLNALARKGIVSITPREVAPFEFTFPTAEVPLDITLTPEQEHAVADVLERFSSFGVNLLYGVTGSGKTEVYIHVIRQYLQQGQNVLFLIPEIALTPQMVDRFQSQFGQVLAISHSRLTDRERLQQWHRIDSGECRIVIGARSAIFAPIPRLGLIIVDEEHEQTYKQDNLPRYNGRDMAIVRASITGAQVILGSATPSLESWSNSLSGKYRRQELLSRPPDINLPRVDIIDLRDAQAQELLSGELIAAIASRLERGEQSILFQNRRGYSSFMQCLKCGRLITCSNCEISMYYHRDTEEMHCHYCGSAFPSPRKCPQCGSFTFSYGAPGTQKVEQTLRLCFPNARILRLDSDSARRKDSFRNMYDSMKKREVDILLGTQMISKGLDFPHVTLVGIVMADISLNVPDFRSAERTFQLITQVAGRSGRGDKPGQVIIQTYNPHHYAIFHASRQDYPAFAEEELSYRRRLFYPPYYRLGRLLYQSRSEEILSDSMHALKGKLANLVMDSGVLTVGPAPAPFARLNNIFRHHLIIKAETSAALKDAIRAINDKFTPPSQIQCHIDIDPLSLM